ncbi:MAG: tetratricopeptide repeat protein [Candidatus Omnitrophota bacterium]|nr:tetratricopeptide repeat protein [Candidatus Omnitrophota bacterium]
MKKIARIIFLGFIYIFTSTFTCIFAQDSPEKKYEDLKKDYQNVLADRDNVLRQAQTYLEYKQKYENFKPEIDKLNAEKDRLKSDLEAKIEQNSLLQQKMEELERKEAQLVQDKETLKNSLEKMQIEYKIVPETNKKITRLERENTELTRRFKDYENKIKRLDEEKLDAYAQYEVSRRQLIDARKDYDNALVKNRQLEKKASEMPSRFAELARENKVLVKETALMHYNLGVFYIEKKQFEHAVRELEKAVELNPGDAYAHYNLGYVYAEQVVDRDKAIDHFRKYLRLAKSEDKDLDWVKNYILTWQTWEAKKKMK